MEPAILIALALILFFAVWGFKEGVVKRLVEVAGAIVTVMLTARFAASLTPRVADRTGWSEEATLLATWVGLIIVGLILSRLLARLVSKVVRLTVLGWVDRLGGALCGAALGTILASALLLVIGAMPGGAQLHAAYRDDPVGAFIVDTAPNLARQASLVAGDEVRDLWDKVVRSADEAADEARERAADKLDEAKKDAEEAARDAVK
jgi:membrane protein required for colicin V production